MDTSILGEEGKLSALKAVRSSDGATQAGLPTSCTSRDGADEGDSKMEEQEQPGWLHDIPTSGDGAKTLNASERGVGSDASLFEDVVCCISSSNAIQHLDLSKNSLEDGHLGPLLAALHGNDSIQVIDLAHNCITDAGAEHILSWLTSQAAAGGSPLSYISLYGNSVTPAAEARLWKAVNGPSTDAEVIASRGVVVKNGSPFRSGHKKSRSVEVAATTLPINAMLCKKAKGRLGEVVQLLETAQAIVSRMPDNLEALAAPPELHCPDEILVALRSYDAGSAEHGPATQPPSAIELLQCIGPSRIACLFDGMQGELSWLSVPGEGATSSEQYMHEKNVKQLQQMETLEYHPYSCKYLFHFEADNSLLFCTGTLGTCLEDVIRSKLTADLSALSDDTLWVYNVVTITESVASSIQFMRSQEVMISLPTVLPPTTLFCFGSPLTVHTARYGTCHLRNEQEESEQGSSGWGPHRRQSSTQQYVPLPSKFLVNAYMGGRSGNCRPSLHCPRASQRHSCQECFQGRWSDILLRCTIAHHELTWHSVLDWSHLVGAVDTSSPAFANEEQGFACPYSQAPSHEEVGCQRDKLG